MVTPVHNSYVKYNTDMVFAMRIFGITWLLVLVGISVAQTAQDSVARVRQAQQYTSEGFAPIDQFAGQVLVRNKRLSRQAFSVFAPDSSLKCCGKVIAEGETDSHGHFFVEPLAAGRYYARFVAKDGEHIASFAVMAEYKRCEEVEHIEVNFLNPKKPTIETFIDINDSGEPCKETEPQCFRK